jgi:hypothetical protein
MPDVERLEPLLAAPLTTLSAHHTRYMPTNPQNLSDPAGTRSHPTNPTINRRIAAQ